MASLLMANYMSFLSTSFFLHVIAPLFLLLIFLYIYNKKQRHGMNTKKYHPYVGNKIHQVINLNTLHDYLAKIAEKHKTFRIFNPLQGEVFTTDPANMEYILRTNFDNYGKGVYIHDILQDLFGEGIFAVDGEKWREQRKVSSHEFSTKVLRDFSSKIFKNNAIKVGNVLSEAANSNQIIHINDLFMKATMDSIFKVGFGVDLENMSDISDGSLRCASHAFDDANPLILRRFVDKLWKIKRFLNIGSEAVLKKNIKVIDEFVYKVIETKIEQMHESNDEFSFKKEDILSRFVQFSNRDPKYLRDIILGFVLAGKDPIAVTLSWLIYMLCKHPEIQDKVAKEIKEATNMNEEITNVADFAALVSEEALDKMHYLHAALTETMRLYPPVAIVTKMCFSDDVFPDGFNVRKGDMIACLPYAMGRMKFIWGEDALEFKPERWLDNNGCFRQASPFKFVAFQAGPRTCLGRDYSYMQMKIFSSILLGCFTFKLSDENKITRYRWSINLHIDGQLSVFVFNRLAGLTNPQN